MLENIILFPYWLTLKIRDRRYRKGSGKAVRASVPTVCVGNITVGGTGKTPHTEMILRMLLDSDEWGARNIAVLSRGYKRTSKGFQQVTLESSSRLSGDEPLQIKKKFPCVTVAVDKNRVEGCDFLINPEKLQTSKAARKCEHKDLPPADFIILDDAYQYRKLKADLDIVLVDWHKPVTKDSLLPFGRLRDLPSRLYDADVVIVTKSPNSPEPEDLEDVLSTLGYSDYDPVSCTAVTPRGEAQTVLFTGIRYRQSLPMYETSDPRFIYSSKVVLFTGIADDSHLTAWLSDKYSIVDSVKFPDHHRYTRSDFARIESIIKHNPTAALATTEKDAQRVLDCEGMPQRLKERMFYVPIAVDFLTDAEREVFRRKLLAL